MRAEHGAHGARPSEGCPHVRTVRSRPPATALATEAEARCGERGEAWTAARRRVYELLLATGEPCKAYDLIAKFRGPGRVTSPATVYRALDFLVEAGLAHRIVSDNAFIACTTPDRPHAAQFVICECCGRAAEFEADTKAAMRRATLGAFQVSGLMLEARGLCPDCR